MIRIGVTDVQEDQPLAVPHCTAKIPPLLAEYRKRTNRLNYVIEVLKINNVVLLLVEAELWLFF